MAKNQLRDFERVLDRCLGRGSYPQQLIGDLDDLLMTITKAEFHIRALVDNGQCASAELSSKLYALQMVLEDELALILQDVVPLIKAAREGKSKISPSQREDE